ncbi:MAG: tRNA lysidine(34) synthetase TilS [Clostridia bacterium]|nr:tRNA lysidine(34) synthetase TilS [Clostridia bacterium]
MIECAKLNRYNTLALAVSGGKDSMCLLHYFIARRDSLPNFFVINFEHGIRGKDSVDDSSFVEQYCKCNGIRCDVVKLDCIAYCKNNGYTIEQGARLLRRGYYCDIVKSRQADRVITAHHKGDNAESVLMHIARGSGLKGICGIPYDDGVILRPMLDVSRAVIDNYCKDNAVPYREDNTNADMRYDRNYMRRIVLPALKERYNGIEDNLTLLSQRAMEADSYIRLQCVKADISGNVAILPFNAFAKEEILAKYSVIDALERLGNRVDISAAHINDIIALKDMSNGSDISLPYGYVAERTYDGVHIFRRTEKFEGEVPFALGEIKVGGYIVEVGKEYKPRSLKLDLKGVPENAVWRTRRNGDKFLPFGGGRRSLGDWFTDKKVPKYLRDNIPVLAIDSEVLTVPPYEICRKLAVDDNSVDIAYITLRRDI